MWHLFRTVEALVILLIAVITTEVGGGFVPNAAADTLPPVCSYKLILDGKGPEGPGYWTLFKAAKNCDRPSNVLVNYPNCTRARCRPGQKAQCNICVWIDWISQNPAIGYYYVNDAGCLRYICDRLPR